MLAILLAGIVLVWGLIAYSLARPPKQEAAVAPPTALPTGTSTPTEQVTITWPPTWTPSPQTSPTSIFTATYTGTVQTVTATPTIPLLPSPTILPTTAISPLDGSPTPTPTSTLPIPTPVNPLAVPDNAITILLLGSDQRPDWTDWHTDAVQYLVIFPNSDPPAANILSIPRDLYLYIPDFWMSRINFADMYGEGANYEGDGFDLLNETLLYNLGVSADYYVKVNFDGLIGLVNALGGIDVPVHCRLEDYWPYPDEAGNYNILTLEPGIHHMDGEMALWYSRSRKTTSVFSRERRQQQVLEAMWRKGKESNLVEVAPSAYEQTKDLFKTNLDLPKILELAITASKLDSANVRRYNIGAYDVYPYVTQYGGNVFLPNWERIEWIVNAAINPPSVNRAAQDMTPVEIWNGTDHDGWDLLAADRMVKSGYLPIIGIPDQKGYAQTQVVSFTGGGKGVDIGAFLSLFDINEQQVTYQDIESYAAPLRLIIGEDYVTCPD